MEYLLVYVSELIILETLIYSRVNRIINEFFGDFLPVRHFLDGSLLLADSSNTFGKHSLSHINKSYPFTTSYEVSYPPYYQQVPININIDGPKLSGFSNGALGTTGSGDKVALSWNSLNQVYMYGDVYLNGSGKIHTSSDMRLKSDIEKIDNPTETLSKINGYSFTWNGENERDLGVIAQEIETVLPELVKEIEGGIKTVDYTGLIPVLIEAIKEQQAQIESLKDEVETLKAAP